MTGMAKQDANGQRIWGYDTPRVSEANVQVGDSSAVVHDCQDASHGGVADRASGRHLTVGKVRTPVVATLHRGTDRGWRVVYVSYPKSSC